MRRRLVHGMERTPLSLTRLTRFLQQRGDRPERLRYVAAAEGFERIRTRVRRRLEALARTGEPYADAGSVLGTLALVRTYRRPSPSVRARDSQRVDRCAGAWLVRLGVLDPFVHPKGRRLTSA